MAKAGLTPEEALGAANSYTKKTVLGMGAIKGDKGDPGRDGKSAYDIAVEHGFEGTEEEWLESIKGAGAIVYVSSTPQTGMYNIEQAIRDSIEEVLKSDTTKDGALISAIQPFNDGGNTLMCSGYVLDHGDEIWSGSMVFSVPTPITSINFVGTYDFQYIRSTNQLSIEKTMNEDDMKLYAVPIKQDWRDNEKILKIYNNKVVYRYANEYQESEVIGEWLDSGVVFRSSYTLTYEDIVYSEYYLLDSWMSIPSIMIDVNRILNFTVVLYNRYGHQVKTPYSEDGRLCFDARFNHSYETTPEGETGREGYMLELYIDSSFRDWDDYAEISVIIEYVL